MQSITQNKQMTAIGYISYTEEIIKAIWSNCQHDHAAAFKLNKMSPVPPELSAKDLPGGRTEVLNVQQIQRIHFPRAESDEDCAHESISDTENWLHWNGDFDIPNDSYEDREANIQSNIVHDKGNDDAATREQHDVSAAPNIPGLIQPTWMSLMKAREELMTVNTMDTRRNKSNKKMSDMMRQCIFTRFLRLFG